MQFVNTNTEIRTVRESKMYQTQTPAFKIKEGTNTKGTLNMLEEKNVFELLNIEIKSSENKNHNSETLESAIKFN
jgi:hypothetical protein